MFFGQMHDIIYFQNLSLLAQQMAIDGHLQKELYRDNATKYTDMPLLSYLHTICIHGRCCEAIALPMRYPCNVPTHTDGATNHTNTGMIHHYFSDCDETTILYTINM